MFKAQSVDGDRTVTFTGIVDADTITFTRDVQVKDGGSPGGNGILGALAPRAFNALRVSPNTTTPPVPDTDPELERRDRPVTDQDLSILLRAAALPPSEAAWNRKDDRQCEDDEAAGKRSLFCVLQKATTEVLGEYDHRRVALQEVRFAVVDATGGQDFEHRMMDYNNLAQTTFADIKRVLAVATLSVRSRLPK